MALDHLRRAADLLVDVHGVADQRRVSLALDLAARLLLEVVREAEQPDRSAVDGVAGQGGDHASSQGTRVRSLGPSSLSPRRQAFVTECAPVPHAALSPRELSVLRLIGGGLSNKSIARSLAIAPETVKTHVRNAFIKLEVQTRAQAVAQVQALGLFDPPQYLPA